MIRDSYKILYRCEAHGIHVLAQTSDTAHAFFIGRPHWTGGVVVRSIDFRLAEACRTLADTHTGTDKKFLEGAAGRAEAAAGRLEQTILRQARWESEDDDMPRVPWQHLRGRTIFKDYKIYYEAFPRVLGREGGNSLFFVGYQRRTRPARIVILDLTGSLEEACRKLADWMVADRAVQRETLSEAIEHIETMCERLAQQRVGKQTRATVAA